MNEFLANFEAFMLSDAPYELIKNLVVFFKEASAEMIKFFDESSVSIVDLIRSILAM